jgi:hypothetical protein
MQPSQTSSSATQQQIIKLQPKQTQLAIDAIQQYITSKFQHLPPDIVSKYVIQMIHNNKTCIEIAQELEPLMGPSNSTTFVNWLVSTLVNASSTLLVDMTHETSTSTTTTTTRSADEIREELRFKMKVSKTLNELPLVSTSLPETILLEGDARVALLNNPQLLDTFRQLHEREPYKYPLYRTVTEFTKLNDRERLKGSVHFLIEQSSNEFPDAIEQKEKQNEKRMVQEKSYDRQYNNNNSSSSSRKRRSTTNETEDSSRPFKRYKRSLQS